MKQTCVYQIQRRLDAKFVDFHGWELPLYYSSIIKEHLAVRQRAGLFDISHMGQINITGSNSFRFLQGVITSDLNKAEIGGAIYAHLCNENGGIIDDIFIYRLGEEEFFLVVNSSNIKKDFSHLQRYCLPGIKVINRSEETGALALSGPRSPEIIEEVFPGAKEISHHHLIIREANPVRNRISNGADETDIIVSRTGYTGEDGFEIFGPGKDISQICEKILKVGTRHDLLPCGLGARDSLRMEMGYPLYGNDIDEEHTPLEAGFGWVVSFHKDTFLGREKLLRQKEEGIKRKLIGFIMRERAIPHFGYPIERDEKAVGKVTSGTYSPTLGSPIGMGYVEVGLSKPGTELEIVSPRKKGKARVTELPFYRQGGSSG